ncbi:MAG TPA: hypothetical protein VE379_08120 [Vicinamibacterales bacterium]|jgi:hypothetical protein|nr:hypothetical protein [Vicinamibacterales bacterium]
MRPPYRLALLLYPVAWRRRYGRELEALLEDAKPGPRGWLDLFTGALMMRLNTLRTIPIGCALAGAVIGAITTSWTPTVFGSSATILLNVGDDGSKQPHDIRIPIERALQASAGTTRGTSVMLLRERKAAAQATLTLTYVDRDPSQAQRVAEKLTAAILTEASGPAGSAKVVQAPALPVSPVERDYPTAATSGAGIGLAVGGLAFLTVRRRRAPSEWPPARGGDSRAS